MKNIINTTCKLWEAENVITNCRLAVSKGVIGTGLKYNPIERELLPVYDMQIKAHRMVNLKTVTKLNIYGVHYNVEGRQA